MGLEPKHVQRVLYCHHCGEDMLHHGILEKTYGGSSRTNILFDPGEYPKLIFSSTDVSDIQDQEVYCLNCHELFCNGEVLGWEIVNFYEGYTEFLEGYVEFMGGAPVPNVL